MPGNNGSLVGAAGDDTVNGTTGNDTINLMLGGNDVAYGGDGNDRIITDGGDTLYGGTGVDILDLRASGSTTGFVINIADELAASATGNYDIGDHQTFVNSFETLYFYGGTGSDSIVGGVNNDIINGGGGKDSLYGGDGADSITGHNGTAVVDGGAGNDTLTIDGFVQQVEGGAGLDRLYITGLAGYDAQGHTGAIHGVEAIYVTAGLGPISFSHDQPAFGTVPQDIYHYQASTGMMGDDTYGHQIYVTDVFVNDSMGGHYQGATITGSIYGDTITGGSGGDHLIGAAGNDTLYGGAGNDTLEGGVGGDHLFGGAGNDTVLVLSGPSQQPDATISGGDGIDTLFYNATQFTSATTIDITAAVTTPGMTNISGFEILNYQASNFGDTVHGGSLSDSIWGGAGNDFIFAGTDSVAGTGPGATVNDLVDGMGGTNTLGLIGHSSDFTFTADGAFTLATDTVTGEHVDFKNIQFLSFDNGTDTHPLSDFVH